jgi:hypothetical protein
VVSSDREVQSAARAAQAQSISAEEFVNLLRGAQGPKSKSNPSEKKLSAAEVDEWMKIFGNKRD